MSRLRIDTGRPFRFPFDIDRRVFLVLAAIFFILAIKPVNKLIFPRLTAPVISKRVQNNFEKQYKQFEEFTSKLTPEDLSFYTANKEKITRLNNKSWLAQIYEQDSLLIYTHTSTECVRPQLQKDSFYAFVNDGIHGFMIQKEKEINGRTLHIIGKFPLYIQYKNDKNFFRSHFIFAKDNGEMLEDFGYTLELITPYTDVQRSKHAIYINNTPRFNLVEKSNFLEVTDKNFWRFFFAAIPFILFGVSIHTYYKVSVKRNPLLYFTLLLATAIGIRLLGYLFHFPDDFSEFYLFNPSLYASDGLYTSLGDVFINACLTFWILFFFIMNVQHKIFKLNNTLTRIVFLMCVSALLCFFGYYTASGIKSIVYDSLISFDTTSYGNLTTPVIIGLGTVLLFFMNFVLCTIIYNRYFDRHVKWKGWKFILPLLVLVLSYFFKEDEQICEPMVYAGLWTALFLLFLSSRFFSTKFDFNSYKLIYWLIFLALSCVLIIYYFDTHKEIKLRQNFANDLVRFENKHTENSLKDLDAELREDSVVNGSDIATPELYEYISHKFLHRFQSDYRTLCIISSDSTNDNFSESQDISTALHGENVTKDSAYNLYLVNDPGFEEYLLQTHLLNKKITIILRPKYFNIGHQKASFLSTQFTPARSVVNSNYQLAFYENDTLISQSSIEDFPNNLPDKWKHHSGIIKYRNGQNDIIAHNHSGLIKKSVIITKKENALNKISTTYAYLFTIIFLLITIYILGNIVARSNLRPKRLVNLLGLTLRMRIHVSILLVELISLTIVGVVTIIILSNNSKKEVLLNSSLAAKEIKSIMRQGNLSQDTTLLTNGHLNNRQFMRAISPYLEKHNVELNLYALDGKRIFTTVSKNITSILPKLMNPLAQLELLKNGKTSAKLNQQIGELHYYTIYSYLHNERNDKIGIMEIPNFSSLQIIKQNNSDILTMLINIYAFIFILSSLFAFYITKRLTNSFSKIVTQFSKINLTQTNQPLSWPYSDEIGLLIKEYNRTLRKLENSTALLAKSERELAWREMAKQIAHEIKNPLTPMSLSLQSLQMAIKRNDPNLTALTEKMTNTVLEQIKVLTRTASNFSEFAKMIDIDTRKESLIDILESTTGLYTDNEDIQYLFVLPSKDIYVRVDKVKMIRVITNVIQNAVQSIPSEKLGQIILTVTKEANNIVKVTIEDNGDGIPAENIDKVFIPNFTTKSSGSGLGLAMCKDIMTKTGGNIYFETAEGKGSKFHIEIPIYTLPDDQDEDDDEYDENEDNY